MKCRYTLTASAELEESVSYLLTHAPHVAGKFADSIDDAVGELLEHPYSAQQTALAGVYRKYVRAFRYSIFYALDIRSDELVILNIRGAALALAGLDSFALPQRWCFSLLCGTSQQAAMHGQDMK